MPEVIYLNGKFVSPDEAVVPINDRGFLFGDAVYEVLRSYEGRLWAFERHLLRLRRSLEAIDLHRISIDEVRAATELAFRESGLSNALLYLHITRGVAPRTHAYPPDLKPTFLIHVRDVTPIVAEINFDGVAAITAPDLRWRRCDIKSTNLLPNVLASTQAHAQGAHEAILVEALGFVTEAASMSVFCVEEGRLLATPSGPEILPGVTRELVIEIAREEKIPLNLERVSLEGFRAASEIFLTATCHEVCPVVTLDGQPVGDGRAGPITRRLQEAYRARVAAQDDAPR